MNEFAEVAEVVPVAVPGGRDQGISDRKLLRDARRGKPDAVEALIERHWGRAHRIAYGILGDAHAAEDVTQEAMLSIVNNIGRFDPYRPFAPWLHTVVSNRALDFARARARRAELTTDRAPELADGEDPALASSDPALEEALAGLTPEHRAVIVLRFVAGYGPKQIGEVLGVPTGTVGSRLRRALDQLRTDLEVDDG